MGNDKIVGILGGMGPYATCDVFLRIIKSTPAKKDWDHLRIIIDNNPKIPSRTLSFFGNKSPLNQMIETAKNLERSGANFLIIPCNSAHYWIDQLRSHLKIPILSIIEVTSKKILEEYSHIKKIGIVGGYVTISTNLYETEFNKHDLITINPTEFYQNEVMNIIEQVKLDAINVDLLERIINVIKHLIDRGSECIVIACTEIPILLKDYKSIVPLFDANQIIAEKVVEYAKNQCS